MSFQTYVKDTPEYITSHDGSANRVPSFLDQASISAIYTCEPTFGQVAVIQSYHIVYVCPQTAMLNVRTDSHRSLDELLMEEASVPSKVMNIGVKSDRDSIGLRPSEAPPYSAFASPSLYLFFLSTLSNDSSWRIMVPNSHNFEVRILGRHLFAMAFCCATARPRR
ncbi:hypothetical protein BJV77DRAFT_975077 [Russula vinacea]|nr:hypothetical protein BJV77DRAFT_975077 [Russula vinacea]